jgi:hypothetical protein
MTFKINNNIKMLCQVRMKDVQKITEELVRGKKKIFDRGKNTDMNLNSKFSSRRSDGLHFLEEGCKITRNIHFDLQN